MKNLVNNSKVLLCIIVCAAKLQAQMSGTYSVPASFTSIAAAISSLNAVGISGGVTINISAGYTETVVAGGFSMTATGTSANPIVFQKDGSGANPLLTAYVGTAIPTSASQDGIWRLIGSDYITIDGIDITDPNTTNPATMEFGYGFFKAVATNGCQNNMIKNCNISLSRVNNAVGSGPAVDGSRGIDLVSGTSPAHVTILAASSAAGTNSNNKFYSNVIQNCNIGIALIGYAATSPFTNGDTGNDVGGLSAVTGNTIVNFGGGGTTSAAAGIRTLAQYGLNISYNIINSNNGSGSNHAAILRGIYVNTATSANLTVSNNTITVKSGGTTTALTPIENAAGATAASNAVNIINNLITGCTHTTATTGVFTGILTSASCATLNISNNSFINNSTSATSGTHLFISNTGAVTSSIRINSNSISGFTMTSANSGTFNHIRNAGGNTAALLSISSNSIQGFTHAVSGSMTHNFISNTLASINHSITNNTFTNLVMLSTGGIVFITNSVALTAAGTMLVSGNSVNGTFSKTGVGNSVTFYSSTASSANGASINHINNNFSNITVTGNTGITGWSCTGGAGSNKNVSGNIFSNWNGGTAAVTGITINGGGNNSSISNNTLTGITVSGAITGIVLSASNSGSVQNVSNNVLSAISSTGAITGISLLGSSVQNLNVSSNTLTALATTAGAALSAIASAGNQTTTIQRNRIYNLQAAGANGIVNGILLSGGGTSRVYNNVIADLRNAVANNVNALNGISVTGGSAHNIIYNTIYISAASSGAVFGSSALNVSGTINANVRNNILINTSTPNTTGITAAFRRSSTALTTYSSTSDNNLLYAGTPGLSRALYYDGTNICQTIGAFQATVAPREANSVTENTAFTSTLGSNPGFLHINASITSLSESGGSAVTGYNDDIDGEIRGNSVGYPGTGGAPDIGADEYEPILAPCSGASSGTIVAVTPTCSGQTILLRTSGHSTGSSTTYQWQVSASSGGPYTNVTGGIAPNSTGYTPPTLTTGTSYYVMVTTCSLVPVTATSAEFTLIVNPTPSPAIVVASASLCTGQNFSLNAVSAVGTDFSWTGPNAFTSTLQNPVISNIGFGAAGVYSLIVSTPNCTAVVQTLTTTVTLMPTAIAVTPVSSTLCSGAAQTLEVSGGFIPGTMTFGANNNPNAATSYPAPYTAYLGGQRMQFLILASELNAAGFSAGSAIGSIQFPVSSLGASWSSSIFDDQNFKLNIGATALTSLSSFQTGLTNVVAASNFSPATGINNTHTFSSPYIWNGASNLVIETAFSNSITGSAAEAVVQYTTATPFVSTIVYYADLTDAASIYTTTTVSELFSARPDFKLNGQVGNYSWSAPLGLSSTTGVKVVSTASVSTIYTVSSTNNVCASTATTEIVTNSLPAITVAQSGNTVCAAMPVTFTASGASNYTWTTGSSTIVAASLTVNPVSSAVYTVSSTNSLGCTGSSTAGVTAYPLPNISISPPSATVCQGVFANLNASGASTYLWDGTLAGASLSIAPSTSTIYNVVGTSAQGCTATAAAGVTVNSLPIVVVSPVSASACVSVPTTFTASGASTYSWNTFAMGSNFTVYPAANTGYTVTGTNSLGCSATATAEVITYSLPVVSISPGSPTVCALSPVNLTASGAVSYTWENSATGAGIVFTPSVSTTFSVDGTNADGCIGSAFVTITTNSLPAIMASPGSATVCSMSMASFTASGATSYSWSNGTTGTVGHITPSVSGTYSVSGVSAQNGCIGSTTVAVVTKTLPVIGFLPASPAVCKGFPVNITATGAVTYTWASGISGAVLTATPQASTNYAVTGFGQNGCASTQTVGVVVNQLPVITISSDRNLICRNEPVNLTATGASNYSWTPIASNTATLSFTATFSGLFTVTGTDLNNCTSSQTFNIQLQQCTGIGENGAGLSSFLKVFPNPANGIITARFANSGEKVIRIIDMNGALVRTISTDAEEAMIDLSEVAKGVYCIQVNADGGSTSQRIVLQ
jgi:hypothetical protein